LKTFISKIVLQIPSVIINANSANIRDAFCILEENGLIRDKDNSSAKRLNSMNDYERRPPPSNTENYNSLNTDLFGAKNNKC